jgi:hypothetical protein
VVAELGAEVAEELAEVDLLIGKELAIEDEIGGAAFLMPEAEENPAGTPGDDRNRGDKYCPEHWGL